MDNLRLGSRFVRSEQPNPVATVLDWPIPFHVGGHRPQDLINNLPRTPWRRRPDKEVRVFPIRPILRFGIAVSYDEIQVHLLLPTSAFTGGAPCAPYGAMPCSDFHFGCSCPGPVLNRDRVVDALSIDCVEGPLNGQ